MSQRPDQAYSKRDWGTSFSPPGLYQGSKHASSHTCSCFSTWKGMGEGNKHHIVAAFLNHFKTMTISSWRSRTLSCLVWFFFAYNISETLIIIMKLTGLFVSAEYKNAFLFVLQESQPKFGSMFKIMFFNTIVSLFLASDFFHNSSHSADWLLLCKILCMFI